MQAASIHVRICLFMAILSLSISTESLAANKTTPVLVNYQGLLQDNLGNPLQGTFDMVFSLHDQESGGPFDWQESHTDANAVTTDNQGVFNVVLNSTGSASGNLASLLVDKTEIWMQIEVNGETLSPRQRFTSSAYALSSPWSGLAGLPPGFADNTDDLGTPGTGLDLSAGQFSIKPSFILPQGATNGQVAKWNSSTSLWDPADDLTGTPYTAGNGLQLTDHEFSVDFSGTGGTEQAARSDHYHMGQSWVGPDNPGLRIATISTEVDSVSIHGIAGGNALNCGVIGQTESDTSGSIGVLGRATSISAATTGVSGVTSSPSNASKGVYGHATATSGTTYGVYGQSNSSTGYGVYSHGNTKIDGDAEITGNADVTGNAEIGGDLTVTGSITEAPRTGYYSIPAADFQPSTDAMEYSNNGLFWIRTAGSLSVDYTLRQVAGVHLPHGSTLVKLTFYGHTENSIGGPSGGGSIIFLLDRSSLDGTQQTMTSFTDGDYPIMSPGPFAYEVTSFTNPQIDNSACSYYVYLALERHMKIYGVVLEYTY